MCGSFLSKLKKPSNRVDPATLLFPEPRKVKSRIKLANEDTACHEDRGFWIDGDRDSESSVQFLESFSSESSGTSESDSSSQDDIEAAVRVPDKPVLPSVPSVSDKKVRLPVVDSYINQEKMLLDSAREILAFQGYRASSSSNTMAALPLSSNNSTFPEKIKTAVTFDIPIGNEKVVCPSARVPPCLRKRGKVASELTLLEVREKMRAAEERKLKELERIRECARSRAGVRRLHPAEVSAQATKQKIAAKQAAAEIKRNEEMEKRREAGKRVSRSRDRIAAARAFAKIQIESSMEQNTEESEKGKVKQQQRIDKRKKLQEKQAKKDKNKVIIRLFQ